MSSLCVFANLTAGAIHPTVAAYKGSIEDLDVWVDHQSVAGEACQIGTKLEANAAIAHLCEQHNRLSGFRRDLKKLCSGLQSRPANKPVDERRGIADLIAS